MRERQLRDLCFGLDFIGLMVMVWGRETQTFLLPNPVLLAGLREAAGAIPSSLFPHHLDRRERRTLLSCTGALSVKEWGSI